MVLDTPPASVPAMASAVARCMTRPPPTSPSVFCISIRSSPSIFVLELSRDCLRHPPLLLWSPERLLASHVMHGPLGLVTSHTPYICVVVEEEDIATRSAWERAAPFDLILAAAARPAGHMMAQLQCAGDSRCTQTCSMGASSFASSFAHRRSQIPLEPMGMVMHLPWYGDVCPTDLLPSPFSPILLHICLSVCRAGVIRKNSRSWKLIPWCSTATFLFEDGKEKFPATATDQVDKETQWTNVWLVVTQICRCKSSHQRMPWKKREVERQIHAQQWSSQATTWFCWWYHLLKLVFNFQFFWK